VQLLTSDAGKRALGRKQPRGAVATRDRVGNEARCNGNGVEMPQRLGVLLDVRKCRLVLKANAGKCTRQRRQDKDRDRDRDRDNDNNNDKDKDKDKDTVTDVRPQLQLWGPTCTVSRRRGL
jgi:hypothetical protein